MANQGDQRGRDAERPDQEVLRSDIATIRALMTRYEEQPLVKPWVFYLWGILVAVGTVITVRFSSLSLARQLVLIWVPLMLVGGTAEMVGWVQQARSGGVPLFTRRMNRLLGTYGGLIAIILILVFHMAPTGVSPGVVLALAAMPLLAYAQMTFRTLFVEAYVLLSLGIALEVLLPAEGTVPGLAVGCFIGGVYIIAGYRSRRKQDDV